MPRRLKNPLRGSWHPRDAAVRITNFLLFGAAFLFIWTNRKVFERIVTRRTGVRDPRDLPDDARRTAFLSTTIGTILAYLTLVYLFASSWLTLVTALGTVACYFVARQIVVRAAWGVAPLDQYLGRLGQIVRRFWEAIRHGVP